ncbi:hypothetical protein SODG_006607 [Sodalis praecaptivus]
MRDAPIHLCNAAFRASAACSLYEIILEKANNEEVSKSLSDLISIACDINYEISRTLAALMEDAA